MFFVAELFEDLDERRKMRDETKANVDSLVRPLSILSFCVANRLELVAIRSSTAERLRSASDSIAAIDRVAHAGDYCLGLDWRICPSNWKRQITSRLNNQS